MTQIDPSENANLLRTYRIRVALFLGGVVVALVLLAAVCRGINTLNRLEVVESERDRWQRSAEVLQALNLREGSIVMDLGSGAGYFALKLSQAVGRRGRVVAVDIRRLPLLFLWIRALLRNQHNITVVHGHPDNPRLPAGAVDAVLVANTYHEFTNPNSVLNHAFRSLVPGGRIVVVDRSPRPINAEQGESGVHHHDLLAASAEHDLLQSGFEIVSRQDHFVNNPYNELWWLIVARRPQTLERQGRAFRPTVGSY